MPWRQKLQVCHFLSTGVVLGVGPGLEKGLEMRSKRDLELREVFCEGMFAGAGLEMALWTCKGTRVPVWKCAL